MKIKELAKVFKGSVSISRASETGTTSFGGKSIRIDELYRGQLGKLADLELLEAEIKVIQNIQGSTINSGIPFLSITIE